MQSVFPWSINNQMVKKQMRIFVTGLMMFIGGLGVGLGFAMLPDRGDTLIREVETSVVVQEVPVTTSATEDEESSFVPSPVLEAPLSGDPDLLKNLESRLAEIETRLQLLELSDAAPEEQVPENRREINQSSLQQAGFDESEVSTITSFLNQQQLQRLEIRDRATREGWVDSAEFRQQLRENRSQQALKSSLGEERFDRFLLSQGRNNRVRIDEVMAGSAAQRAGVIASDVISRYAGVIIYNVGELRSATTGGERNDVVALTVIRDNNEVELSVLRGPLGVSVSGIQVE